MSPHLYWFLLPLLVTLGGCTTLGKMNQVLMNPSITVGEPSDQPTQIALSLSASSLLNGNPSSVVAPLSANPLDTLPTPYAVSISATDPHALTGKLQALLGYLQAEFPAMSPVPAEPSEIVAQSPIPPGDLGEYEDAGVQLSLPAPTQAPNAQLATPIAVKILQLRDDSLLLNATFAALEQAPDKALRSTYVRDDDYLLTPGQFKFIPFEAIDPSTRFIAVIADFHDQQDAIWKQSLRIEPRGRKVALAVQVEEKQVLLKEES